MADELEPQVSGDASSAPDAPPVDQPSNAPPTTGGEPSDKKLSLREQLSQNFKVAREKVAKEPDRTPSKQTLDDRPRDETGKFIPKAEAAPDKAAPAEKAPKQEAQPAPAPKPVGGPPPGWSPESKAFYNSLPMDHPLRADIAKRETEVSDGFKKYSDDAKRYQEIEQVLAPARPIYQQNGIRSDAEAIRHLMQWEANIRQNPVAAISQLARSLNIDLASIAQNPPGQSNGQDAVLQYIQPISQQVSSLQGELSRIQSDRAASEIAQFSKDKPYFEKVKTAMGQLMQAGLATDLDSAYQTAIWKDPEIRAEMMQQELDAKVSSHMEQVQQRATQARKAAISPSGKAPAAPPLNGKEKQKGVRGSILAAVEEIREGSRA